MTRPNTFREGLNRLVVHDIPYVICRIGTHMFDVFRIYSYSMDRMNVSPNRYQVTDII